jgi:hypothetical protein
VTEKRRRLLERKLFMNTTDLKAPQPEYFSKSTETSVYFNSILMDLDKEILAPKPWSAVGSSVASKASILLVK